ncbi:rhomboid family intramembrane serine protease [Bounagaea algeriensis]
MNRLPQRPNARVLPANPARSAVGMLLFLAVLYAVQSYLAMGAVNSLRLINEYGIVPREVDGLDGILWAPLLHGGWSHLVSNTVPFFVLGWLALSGGVRQFLVVTATVWITAGVGTWLVGAPDPHIGASSLVFGWMVFLLLRGFLQRNTGQIAVAIVLFIFWGSMLWGVLPGQPGVSWEGHLFGAFGGALAAWLVARSTRRPSGSAPGGTLYR